MLPTFTEVHKENKGAVLINHGGSYATVCLLNGTDLPKDLSRLQRIGIEVSVASTESEDMDANKRLDEYGIVNAVDSMYMHLKSGEDLYGNQVRVYIHPSQKNMGMEGSWGEGAGKKMRIYRCYTLKENPYSVHRIQRCEDLEHALQAGVEYPTKKAKVAKTKTEEESTKAPPVASLPVNQPEKAKDAPVVTEIAVDTASAVDDTDKLGFNPREYILLEKAFHGTLNEKDLKDDATRFTAKDIQHAKKMLKDLQAGILDENKNTEITKDTPATNETTSVYPKKDTAKAKTVAKKHEKETKTASTNKSTPTNDSSKHSNEKLSHKKSETDKIETPKKKAGRPKESKSKTQVIENSEETSKPSAEVEVPETPTSKKNRRSKGLKGKTNSEDGTPAPSSKKRNRQKEDGADTPRRKRKSSSG